MSSLNSTKSHSDIQFELLNMCPLLVPTNAEFSMYDGFVEASGTLFRVSLVAPNYPCCKDIVLNCDWELSVLLKEHTDMLAQWAGSDILISEFMKRFYDLLVKRLKSGECLNFALENQSVAFEEQLDNLQRYSTILPELKELGTNHLGSISADLKNISLNQCDIHGDTHTLNLKLFYDHSVDSSRKHPLEVVDTDLPDAIVKLIQKESNITKALKVFSEQIEALHVIWDALSLIDEQCWVIDPTHPRKADMYRRIFITPSSVMATLSWDPLHPNQPPVIKFQGADTEVDALLHTYEEHMEEWNTNASILDNICSVLQLPSLPTPPPPEESTVSQTVETGECSICYSALMEGKLPEESCGKCLLNFHVSCLYEWLEMMPGSRQVHGHISGPCPNCETDMKCPCPHALD